MKYGITGSCVVHNGQKPQKPPSSELLSGECSHLSSPLPVLLCQVSHCCYLMGFTCVLFSPPPFSYFSILPDCQIIIVVTRAPAIVFLPSPGKSVMNSAAVFIGHLFAFKSCASCCLQSCFNHLFVCHAKVIQSESKFAFCMCQSKITKKRCFIM